MYKNAFALRTVALLHFLLTHSAGSPEGDKQTEASASWNADIKPHGVAVGQSGALHRTRHLQKPSPSLMRHERARQVDKHKIENGPAASATQKEEVLSKDSDRGQQDDNAFSEWSDWVHEGRRGHRDTPSHHVANHRLPPSSTRESAGVPLLLESKYDIVEELDDQDDHLTEEEALTLKKYMLRKHAPAPPPCAWGAWQAWTTCTKECAKGTHTRHRGYTGPCSGATMQTEHCNLQACPINCVFTTWGAWAGCSHTCGWGETVRYRSKDGPFHGGAECSNDPVEEKNNCNSWHCPVDCQWNAWQEFGDCSKSCGSVAGGTAGVYTRERTKMMFEHGGKDCDGSDKHTTHCNTFECPIDCVWTEWEDWSECPVTCGGANGVGIYEHKRTQDPEMGYGGVPCLGVWSMNAPCNLHDCPIDCVWSSWTDWGGCSATCGKDGLQNRTREFSIHAMHGGAVCQGENITHTECNVLDCPIDCMWAEWDEWSNCSEPCADGEAVGQHQAIRARISHARFGGIDCNGTDLRAEPCNIEPCVEIKARTEMMHQVFLPTLLLVIAAGIAW